MAAIDRISSVHIRTYEKPFAFIPAKGICLVRTSVGTQDGIFVNIVSVRPASARVVLGEFERIEVLMCCYDRKEVVMVFVCRCRKYRLDYLAGYGDRVVLLQMQLAPNGGIDCRRDIVPLVCLVFLSTDFNGCKYFGGLWEWGRCRS